MLFLARSPHLLRNLLSSTYLAAGLSPLPVTYAVPFALSKMSVSLPYLFTMSLIAKAATAAVAVRDGTPAGLLGIPVGISGLSAASSAIVPAAFSAPSSGTSCEHDELYSIADDS